MGNRQYSNYSPLDDVTEPRRAYCCNLCYEYCQRCPNCLGAFVSTKCRPPYSCRRHHPAASYHYRRQQMENKRLLPAAQPLPLWRYRPQVPSSPPEVMINRQHYPPQDYRGARAELRGGGRPDALAMRRAQRRSTKPPQVYEYPLQRMKKQRSSSSDDDTMVEIKVYN